MLKRFEVENYKGFKDRMVIDFTGREYAFNKNLVKDGIVNKALIYGKNGIGKSDFGVAMFDIIMHLTDKERIPEKYLNNYLNLNSNCDYASFKYVFVFDDTLVEYSYKKRDAYNLIEENFSVDGKSLINYNYFNKDNNFLDNSIIRDLQVQLMDNRLSILKYIYRNSVLDVNSPLVKMMNFVENMLWYRGLSDGNTYFGYTNGSSNLVDKLYESGKIYDFQAFLKENELDYDLMWINYNGRNELMVKFNDNKITPFVSIASTGTMSLFLFYIWSISAFDNISLLFIDEFDAFFHYESAENIVKRLNSNRSFQTSLTTHNTYLMQNSLVRPDTCFLMTKNKIKNLYDSTDKEIREAHNLEKMYINGAFSE